MSAAIIVDENDQGKSLTSIEKAIIALVGDDIGSYNIDRLSYADIELVENLLSKRMWILNEMFQTTVENMARFRVVNQHLYELTQNLHNRIKIMVSKTSVIFDCSDFDDDYIINGWLRYIFDGVESVLTLSDDAYYGSRFALMIKTLYELYKHKGSEDIESAYPWSEPLDNGDSWNESPFCCRQEFENEVICHAVHELTNHKAYSIPDLLRLNDFWCEVQVRVQNFAGSKKIRNS